MAIHDRQITLVRVRRLRYAYYGLPDIAVSCRREILELRGIPLLWETGCKLSGFGARTGTGTGMPP